jgi:hypothetical protein
MVAILPVAAGVILIGGVLLLRQSRWPAIGMTMAVVGSLGLAAFIALFLWSYLFPVY